MRGAAVTPATDVFALGATLAYAATADSPFGHGSSEVMLYRVVHEEAHLLGVPDALAPLVQACLAKDPEDRPSTLQLSMRLKEIAAREAQGITDGRPPAQRARPERPTGRLADDYVDQRTERRTAGTPALRPHGSPVRRPRAARTAHRTERTARTARTVVRMHAPRARASPAARPPGPRRDARASARPDGVPTAGARDRARRARAAGPPGRTRG